MYIASFRGKFITDLVQLNGSTHPNFDIWPNRRSKLNLGRPRLEFGSFQETFDVWPRPKNLSDRFHLRGQQLCNFLEQRKVLFCERRQTCSKGPVYTHGTTPFHCVVHQYGRFDVMYPQWGEKEKKRGQRGKIRNYRRGKRVERWIAEGERAPPFLSLDYLSARFARHFSSFFPQCGAWSQAKTIFVCFPYPRIFPLLLFLPGVKTKWEQS